MDPVPLPITRRPDGMFLVHDMNDRANRVAGLDFGGRLRVLYAIDRAVKWMPHGPDFPALEEAYVAWASVTLLRSMMRSREMTWAAAKKRLEDEIGIPPIFKSVDLRNGFVRLRRRLHEDVFEKPVVISSQDLNRVVIRLHFPDTAEGEYEADRLHEVMALKGPVRLPHDVIYKPAVLAAIVAYYGLGERLRVRKLWAYKIRWHRLWNLMDQVAYSGGLNLRGLPWMAGKYVVLEPA